MLRHLLEAAVEVSFEIAFEVSNQVPHPGIRIERQAANWNPGYEITSRGEEHIDQPLVLGEKKNIAHQAPDGLRGGQFLDPVLRALLEKKQSRDRGRAVLTGAGQLSG